MFAGLTMVSNIKYYSFKTINLKKSVPFVALLLIVVFLLLLSYRPPIILFAGFALYAIAGYAISAWFALRGRHSRGRKTQC